MDCDACLELLGPHDQPDCLAPAEGQEPCPLAKLELWAANREAWEIYRWAGQVTQPAENHLAAAGNGMAFKVVTQPGLRPPPLDLPGVIKLLEWLGLSPGPEEDREGLMDKLLIIHTARQQAEMEARQAQPHD